MANHTNHKFPTATPMGVPCEVKSTVIFIQVVVSLWLVCGALCIVELAHAAVLKLISVAVAQSPVEFYTTRLAGGNRTGQTTCSLQNPA